MKRDGVIRIKIDELLKESGMSRDELSCKAQIERTQLEQFCEGQLARMSTDVLARLCWVFNCTIGDLLEFVPAEPEED